jgi:DNA polymerase III delta prime subunit
MRFALISNSTAVYRIAIPRYISVVDAMLNPYVPGAGRRPAELVGRERQQRMWEVGISRLSVGRSAQHLCFYGLRGVGKTVLVSDLAAAAKQHGWVVAKVEADPSQSLRQSLGEALHAPLSDLAVPKIGSRLRKALKTAASFVRASYDSSGTWSFGLDLSQDPGGGADTGTLHIDLNKLVADLSTAQEGKGLAILIDEAQDLTTEEMSAICTIAHRATQETWPFLLAVAGLPSLPRMLAEARSYTERMFAYEVVGSLPDEAAAAALRQPSESEGVHWTQEAVSFLVKETRGYPYFLQQYGQEVWNTAVSAPFTLADARLGAAHGRLALDSGFFRSSWERATRAEQKYLRAMAQDGDGGSATSEIAHRLGGSLQSYGPTRAKLINKGLIYAPEHGEVAFTVPTMAEFIQRQP